MELAELATMAGGLAHEIRNPLSTLKMNLQLLAEDWRSDALDDADRRRRSLNRIDVLQAEADRLDQILQDFLRLIVQHEPALSEHDLNAVILQMIDFFGPQATNTAVRVRTSLCNQPLVCRLDINLFKQAVLNVLLNAQQAMPDGGELIVQTRAEDDGTARIDITDTGTGMPPEQLDKAFDAFYSSKKDGTGLGLAMTRRIVREHGGTIVLESAQGKGTNVILRLPKAKVQRDRR